MAALTSLRVRPAVCLAALLSASPPAHARPAGAASTKAEVDLAREYVLTSCIIQRYPDTPLAREADIWASGLIENGKVAGSAYPRLADLARANAPAPLLSRPGVAMKLQGCLKLYNDPDLPRHILQILRVP